MSRAHGFRASQSSAALCSPLASSESRSSNSKAKLYSTDAPQMQQWPPDRWFEVSFFMSFSILLGLWWSVMRCTVQHSPCGLCDAKDFRVTSYSSRTMPRIEQLQRHHSVHASRSLLLKCSHPMSSILALDAFLAPLHLKDMQPYEVQSATSTIIDVRKQKRFTIII